MTKALRISMYLGFTLLAAAVVLIGTYALGAQALPFKHQPTGQSVPFTFFSATTTNATSTNGAGDSQALVIAGAKKITLTFSRGGASGPNTGATKFRVQTSQDGGTYVDFNKLIGSDVSGTGTSTVTFSGTSTVQVSMNLTNDNFYKLRCVALEFTDGEHTCSALAEF